MAVGDLDVETSEVDPPSRLPQWLGRSSNLAIFALVLLGYAIGARSAFWLTDRSGLEAVFFVPAGITLGVLLLVPTARWPIVIAAAALAELGLDLRAGLSLPAGIGFAAANTVEPVVGALLVRRLCAGRVDLARLGHLVRFLIAAVVLGPLVGAAIGAGVDTLTSTDDFTMTLTQWWLGDALGALIIGSTIVARVASPDRRPTSSPAGIAIAVGSVTLTAAVLMVADLPLLFLVLVGVVVAGAQFGTRTVTVAGTLIAVTVAVVLAFDDGELLVGTSAATALVIIKMQLGIFTIAGLVVAAEANEREAAMAEASLQRESEAGRRRLRNVIDGLFINVGIADQTGVLTDINETAFQASGRHRDSALGHRFWELPMWSYDPATADLLRREIETAVATREVRRFDITGAMAAGPTPLDFQIVPLLGRRGRVDSLVMSSIDITDRVRREAEQAELLDQQRTIALHLQQSLLPTSLPPIDGHHLGAVYHSAVESLEVGGDWYDVFETNGKVALVIGDVVGRGLDAAGATGQLRMVIRALAEGGEGPAAVITKLDRFVTSIPAAFAATVLYLDYDPATGTGRFCRAGHIPPLFIEPSREPHFDRRSGSPPLGVATGAGRHEVEFALRPGGLIVLCTDGLIERRGETLDDGMRRLTVAALRHLAVDADQDLSAALAAVADELGNHSRPDDDVCAVALGRSVTGRSPMG